MNENIINNMADEAKSVEELIGRYQQWPDSGRSVARDVARRYLIIRAERDALKDEIAEAHKRIAVLVEHAHASYAPFRAQVVEAREQVEWYRAALRQCREALRFLHTELSRASNPLSDIAIAALTTPPEQEA